MADNNPTWEEYREQVLESLGEDYTVEDIRNNERWHLKVLEGLDGISGGGPDKTFSITGDCTITIS